MKSIALLSVLLCFAVSLSAQDLIHFRDGQVLPAKVISVGPVINYMDPEGPEGVNYFEYEEEVVKIDYESGETVLYKGYYMANELFVDKLHFFEGNNQIKRKNFIAKLEGHDPSVRQEFVAGNTMNILGYSLMSAGTFVLLFEGENWIYGGAPFRPGVYLISGAAAGLGFLLERKGGIKVASALKSYNRAQGITCKPIVSSNGIGLALSF
jgi:hypothetical protein